MAQLYGPPSDGSVIPHELEDAIAADLADSSSPIGGGASGVFSPLGVASPRGLDIWPGWDSNSTSAGNFDDRIYTDWIAGIDASVGAHSTKEQIGTATDGITPIYAYTAGPTDALHALLISGTHPHETSARHAGLRFFEQYAKGTHPAMRDLRNRVRLTWIPTLTPDTFRTTRENSAGVDVNRNFDFNWGLSTDEKKGTAPFSEAESQALRNLLDTSNIACVIDSHLWGNNGADVKWGAPTEFTVTSYRIAAAAASQWKQLYGHEATIEELFKGGTPGPTMRNWAGKYLAIDKGRTNAAAFLVEVRGDMDGSNGSTVTTQGFMRWHNGLVYLYLLQWLQAGQSYDPIRERSWYGVMSNELPTQNLAAGGTLIDSVNPYPVQFEYYAGYVWPTRRKFLDFPVPTHGVIKIEVHATLEGDDANTEHQQVQLSLAFGKAVQDATLPPQQGFANSYAAVPPPQKDGEGAVTAKGRQDVSTTFLYTTRFTDYDPKDPVYRVAPLLRLMKSGPSIKVRNMRLTVTHIPDFGDAPMGYGSVV